MNRLSFGMKFSLVSLLFFVPMALTNFYLVRDSYREFVGTRSELQSLELLGAALRLRRDLEDWHDLVQVEAIIGQTGNVQTLNARLQDVEGRLASGLQALQPVSSDPQQVTEFNTRRDQMQRALGEAQAEQSLQSKAAMAGSLLGSSQVIIKLIASQSGLSQDAEREVRLLAELLTSVTPTITSVLGEGRAVGAYTFGQGYLNSEASNILDGLVQELEKLQTQYQAQLQDAVDSSSAARARLAELATLSGASLGASSEIIQDEVILADALDRPWDAFYERISNEMAKTYELNDAVLDFLDQRLQQRLADKRLLMGLLLAALVVVFLLVAYLYGAFYVSTRASLNALGRIMDKVADGDMTVRYQVVSRDELGELGQVFNATVARIRELIERVGHTVGEVERQAGQVEQVSGQSNQTVGEQRAQIEQVATAMNEMAATAQAVATSAEAAVGSAQSVNEETASGRALVVAQVGGIERLAAEIQQSVEVINRLADDSAAISKVLDVIKGIAEQTNLLALNAAIEAARAGEAGRGFAVVADEVRGLAQRTAGSTQEIRQLIERLQEVARQSAGQMEEQVKHARHTAEQGQLADAALGRIVNAIDRITELAEHIATHTDAQSDRVRTIRENSQQIHQLSDANLSMVGHTRQHTQQISQRSRALLSAVSAFRI